MVIPDPIKLAINISHGVSFLILRDLVPAIRNLDFQDQAICDPKARGHISKYTEVQVQLTSSLKGNNNVSVWGLSEISQQTC